MSTGVDSEFLTFLFADLESSTRLWETMPEAMGSALERHDLILNEAVEAWDGRILKSTGDGMFAVFSSAPDAVRACVDGQRRLQDEPWGETGPLRVRMGMHTGEAQSRAGDYFGPPVNRAARIMGSAHGGQVLLSALTAELVAERLPDEVALRDLGPNRLKDLLEPERLFQVVHPRLPDEFPPLATLDTRPNNLPIQISEFLGRNTELREIRSLLGAQNVRLLTLVGPGGIGKTRLALQAAADQIDVTDGLYFVDLSPVRDPAAALESIARAVGVSTTGQEGALEPLKRALSSRQILLLLDNFEQVIDAAEGIGELLRASTRAKFLVTSREALRLRGERLYRVPLLELPTRGARTTAEALAGYEAVRLFTERAREAQPAFALTDENADAVAEICLRLDGLPLAIELAAARLRLFSVDELRERLRGRLQLLRGGARDLPARQRTLRSTIEWSYELLDTEERSLFSALSVFSPTRVGAVEEVATRLKTLGDVDVVECLTSLADKSLIRSSNGSGPTRLTMLETVREYAAERLEQEPDFSAEAKRAHAEYFSDFALGMRDRLQGPAREQSLDELEAEIGNLSAAWRYWVGAAVFEKLNSLVDSLWALYDDRGRYHEAVELTSDLLRVLGTVASTPERAREEAALRISLARGLMAIRGYTEEVEEAHNRARILLRDSADVSQRYQVLRSLASLHLYRSEFDKATAIGWELLEIAEREQDTGLQVEGHLLVGCNVAFQGDVTTGLSHLDKAIALFDPERHESRRFRLGPSPGVVPYTTSALLLWMMGYPDRATERAGGAVELAGRLDHPFTTAYALFHVGLLDLWRGELELVRKRAEDVLVVAEEHDYQVWKAVALVLRGVALSGLGQSKEGIEQSEWGIVQYQGLKTPPIFWPVLLSLRASAFALGGRPVDALESVDAAIEIVGDGDMLSTSVTLLKGDILAALSDREGARTWYRKALEISNAWGARMPQLQAATRLVHLGPAVLEGEADATEALQSVYETFTEGFGTHDLVEARSLLERSGDRG